VIAGLAACAAGLNAQLVSAPSAIPRGVNPPVVFVNGYQAGCSGNVTFEGTFGQADRILQADGRVSLFFNNCEQARNRPIEELGAALRRYVEALRYADGQPVPSVDVVAHSMGGLIVRSYLSGKQAGRGEFTPPQDVKIRKAVFVAVPFFGAIVTEFPGAAGGSNDPQFEQLRPGSAFLYDLAIWNQGIDDLREIDAIAVVADGGSGIVSGNGMAADDSTVSVTSASLDFLMPDRTRVVNYCHTRLTGLLALGCSTQTPVAAIDSDRHDTARIILSFLNDTPVWRTVGSSTRDHPRLSTTGGILAEVRDGLDAVAIIQTATAAQGRIRIRGNERIWSEDVPVALPLQIAITQATGTIRPELQALSGATRVFRLTDGAPNMAAVLPSPSRGRPRVTAPGMFVTIYGSGLATTTAQAGSQPYPDALGGTEVVVDGQPAGVQYVSPTQVNILMPDPAAGAVKLMLRNPLGQQTVNILVEPSVPTLFGAALNAQTGAPITPGNPARHGDFVALYLTGLGLTEPRSDGLEWAIATTEVSIGGRPCPLLYAGRAPGFSGLDQINCRIAADADTGDTVTVFVNTGKRTGTAAIPVR
jgi:uncharacterized protein (TIGR03437 family)